MTTTVAAKTTTNPRGGRFLRGPAVRCLVLLLWIARSSGHFQAMATKQQDLSKKQDLSHLLFDKLQHMDAAVQVRDHHNPDSRRGLSAPDFQQMAKYDFQQGFNYDKTLLHLANKEHQGDRRVQDACDTEQTAFYECLPDDGGCKGCYDLAIQAAYEKSDLCIKYEALFCTSLTTCSCGCESEADTWLQCLYYEDIGCSSTMFNCTDTTCQEEIIAITNCDPATTNISCFSCVLNSFLQRTDNSTGLCTEIEDAFCPALEPCDCGDCSDEVREWFACISSDGCNGFDCDTTSCDVERASFYGCLPDDTCIGCYEGVIQKATDDSTLCQERESLLCKIPTTCPCGLGCESEADIFYQCILQEATCNHTINCTDTVCDEESIDASNCVDTLQDDSCLNCVLDATDPPESIANCTEFEDSFCLALKSCGCDYCSDKVREYFSCVYSKDCPSFECRTSPPTMATSIPSSEVDQCFVCSDPKVTVDSSKTVIIDGESRPCGEVQEEYATTQFVTVFECNIIVNLVEKSCGCQVILPPTVSPTSPPDQEETSSNLPAVSALVAIPLLAVILHLVIRKKRENRKRENITEGNRRASRNTDVPDSEFDEAPPVTPAGNTPSHRQNTVQSSTESVGVDHYMYSHGGEPVYHISDGMLISGNAMESGGETSRQYRDPSGIVKYTAPYAFLPKQKDQCRMVPREQQIPTALVVDDDEVSVQSRDVVSS